MPLSWSVMAQFVGPVHLPSGRARPEVLERPTLDDMPNIPQALADGLVQAAERLSKS
jgi:hypothetical protein